MRRSLAALVLTTALVGLPATTAVAAPVPVTPGAPVVTEGCGVAGDSFVLPETAGVEYSLTLDGERGIIPEGVSVPGSLAALAALSDTMSSPDEELPAMPETVTVTLDVTAQDGYVLADGVPSTVEITFATAPCGDPAPVQDVTVTSTACESVTLANPASNPAAFVMLDSWEGFEPTFVEEQLDPGESTTVPVTAGLYEWTAINHSFDPRWVTGEDAEATPGADVEAGAVRDGLADLPRVLGGRSAAPDDYVLTAEELAILADLGELFDAFARGDLLLGEGEVEVAACEAEEPGEPEDTATTDAPTPVDGPEIPSVVQTG